MDINNLTPTQRKRLKCLTKLKRKAIIKPRNKRVKPETVWKVKQLLAEGYAKYYIARKLRVGHQTIQGIDDGEFNHYPYIIPIDLFGEDMEGGCRLGDARTQH